jgi:four helix bundle protein
MQDHRRLRVWKKAHALAIEVRRVTRLFPRTGYGSLQSQMVRAAESIVINIVEGCGGRSQKDFARFLDISIKSTSELECQLELAKDYGVLNLDHWKRLTKEAVDVRRMLCGLRAKVLRPTRIQEVSNAQTGNAPTGNAPTWIPPDQRCETRKGASERRPFVSVRSSVRATSWLSPVCSCAAQQRSGE